MIDLTTNLKFGDFVMICFLIAIVPTVVECLKDMWRIMCEAIDRKLVLKRHYKELKELEAQLETLKKELEKIEQEGNHE